MIFDLLALTDLGATPTTFPIGPAVTGRTSGYPSPEVLRLVERCFLATNAARSYRAA
jgi:hypothetical protein